MVEQRVKKNNGKMFEKDFANSFPPEVWTYRPSDIGGGTLARFTSESLCDLMALDTKTKNFILIELKSTLGTSVSVRPYSQCMEYEAEEKKYQLWNASLSKDERKKNKEKNKEEKKRIKELYRNTNKGMIKYHQIKALLNTYNDYGIKAYIVITFYRTNNTYAVLITDFVDFWKTTTKKSINEADLDGLVEKDKAIKIKQEYIRKTKNSIYDTSSLMK